MSYDAQRFASQMSHLTRSWRSEMDRRLQSKGLSQARWLVLWYLLRQEVPPTQRELADILGIESPTLARTLDTLEEKKLVQRIPCTVDRRIKRVILTREASQITKDIECIADALREEIFQGIPEEQLELCHRLHAQMLLNLEAASGK